MEPRTSERVRRPSLAFHVSRIITDIGVLIVMGSMSLPFVTTPDGNRTSVEADALPALLLVLPIFAFTMIPDHSRPLPMPLAWVSLILAGAAVPFAIVKYLDASLLASTVDGSAGVGGRLLVFGTIVVVAGLAIGLAMAFVHPRGAPADRRRPAPAPQAASATPAPRTAPTGGPPPTAGAPASPSSAGPKPGEPPPTDRPASDAVGSRPPGVPPMPRVAPPQARRPVIRPEPDHPELPGPARPTGELPATAGPAGSATGCPECNGRVVPIVYGLPSPAQLEAADRGEVHLGGYERRAADRWCPACKRALPPRT